MPTRSSLGRPRFITPMKALSVDALPADANDGWLAEIKYDGYRAIAVLQHSEVALWSRNHLPLDFPMLKPGLARLNCRDAVLDGEVVAVDAAGRSRFQLLQNHGENQTPAIVYYVFDLLQLNGISLLPLPIEDRRKILTQLLRRPDPVVRLSPVFDVSPKKLLAQVRRQGMEGIILKRRGSLYEAGQRSGAWLKIKILNEQEFVIGGFTPPKRSRPHLGAILVGYYDGKKLVYAGKIGTGFNHELLRSLHATLLKRRRENSPFVNLPPAPGVHVSGLAPADLRAVTWVQPELVVQVKFAEWTRDGLLRQPVFLGLRQDKPARSVRRDKPAV